MSVGRDRLSISGFAWMAGGVAIAAIGVPLGKISIRAPNQLEAAVAAIALIYAAIWALTNLVHCARYLVGVTGTQYNRLKDREHKLEMVGLVIIVLIAMMHSSGMRIAALIALGIASMSLGVQDLRGGDPFDPLMSAGLILAACAFSLAFIVVGLQALWLEYDKNAAQEHYEYFMAGLLMISILIDRHF